jgi:hypothetical protein
VILVELAYWRPIDSVLRDLDLKSVQRNDMKVQEKEVFDIERARGHPRLVEGIRGKLLREESIRELGARMGGMFKEVTRRCLEGGEELGIAVGEDEMEGRVAARLSMAFYEEVVKRLEGIRV